MLSIYGMSRSGEKHNWKYLPITQKQIDFTIGTLLGDAYIYHGPRYKNGYLRIDQAVKEFTEWKHSQLGILANPIKKFVRKSNGAVSYYFNSHTHPELSRIHKLFYVNGRKSFTKELFPLINLYALSVWFMDDGGMRKFPKGKGYHLYISTHSFNEGEHKLMIKFFQEKFNLSPIIRHNRGYSFLYFNVPYSYKLASLLEPYLIPAMRYKIGLSRS